MTEYFLGIDLGTSGARLCVIDDNGQRIFFNRAPEVQTVSVKAGYHEQQPEDWWQSVTGLINSIPGFVRQYIRCISVDGTSGTALLCDAAGQPTSPALLYNDNRAVKEAASIRRLAPDSTGAQGTGSSLAKILWLLNHGYSGRHALHQADWIAGKLCQSWQYSDTNNALKLGFDPVSQQWPDWLEQLPAVQPLLPDVLQPGTTINKLSAELATQFGLQPDVAVCAGTTDSIAGFIATGASRTGDAVTALGSTLVVKVISDQPVFAAEYGIYSHRLYDQWLVGGASNTGGAVLKQFFTQEEMDKLTSQLKPEQSTDLDFYPLPATGERFPLNNPAKKPEITPVADRLIFFQALLEGIAGVEKLAYEKLAELGCPYPSRILSTGGGAKNRAWREIRSNLLQCPVLEPLETEAAFGAAKLAQRGCDDR